MPLAQFNHIRLLRYAGFFTYLCVGIPLLRFDNLLQEMVEQQRPPAYVFWWLACYLVFGAVFWLLTHRLGSARFSPLKAVLLAVLVADAVAIGWFSQNGLCALLLVVVAVLLPWLLPLRVALVWAVLQNYALVPVFASRPDFTIGMAILQSSVYLGLSALTFFTSMIAKQQAEARDEQRRLNSELRATRTLLAESSRIAERLRIARELHDLVGHHLTALSLNLEVASHLVQLPAPESADPAGLPDPSSADAAMEPRSQQRSLSVVGTTEAEPRKDRLVEAQEHVRKAQSVAKLLLADVREVVSQMREDDNIDLTQALQTLVEGVPQLSIELQLPPRFTVEDPRRATVLLRCAQEIITNTVRHSGARTLWLAFEHSGGQIIIHARDDGRGSDQIKTGNGLAGMRERLAQFGGRLAITTSRDRGFSLDAWLPLETSP